MKTKFLFALTVCTISLSSCLIHPEGHNKTINYTHLPPEGKTIAVKPFTSVKANGVFNLILQKGETESVLVKDNYPDDLKVVNDGNTLVIMDTTTGHNDNGKNKTNIYVTYNQLNFISLETVGITKTLDTLRANKFNFESFGVGASILLLNTDSTQAYIGGVGEINIAGKAHYAGFNVNGVGELKAKDFKVDSLHITINGVGPATVYANDALYIHVSGIGGVTYYGPGKVVVQESSGIGKIEHGN